MTILYSDDLVEIDSKEERTDCLKKIINTI